MAAAVVIPSDWQIECPEVRQRTSQLYQLGLWTDCVFKVGAKGASVSAHRLVLAMASPVFEALFYGAGALAQKDNAEPIDVPETQIEAFKVMLEYIYTDDITITSCTVAYEVYNLGQKYMFPRLKSESMQYLQSNLNLENVGFTYEFAQFFDEEQLANQCLEIIKSDTLKVLTSDSFPNLKIDTVVKVFSLDSLNIDSELDLCDAALKYTTYNNKEKDALTQNSESLTSKLADKPVDKIDTVTTDLESESDGTKTEDIDSAVAAETNEDDAKAKISDDGMKCQGNDAVVDKGDTQELPIRRAIKHIRFLSLEPQKFSQRDFNLILSQSEILAILLNLTSKSSYMPMPSGFSTDTKSRIQKKSDDGECDTIQFRTIVNDIISRITGHKSSIFYLRKLRCQIFTEIRNVEGQKGLDVFLYCDWEDELKWPYSHTHVTFRLLSNRVNTSPICKEFEYEFGAEYIGTDIESFISWDELMDPENGYVTHDSIIWEVEIRAVKRKVTDTAVAAPSP